MTYSEASVGRSFVLRLHDGDIIHQVLEKFALDHHINAASVSAVGGVDAGSVLIVGPEDGRAETVVPMSHELKQVHEAMGVGTLFRDDDNTPLLHMHLSCGRGSSSVTGCVRSGVKVWQVLEVVITELTNCSAVRRQDPVTGFKLLTL